MTDKGGFPHYMLKEIFEQPRAVRDTCAGRVAFETGRVTLQGVPLSDEELRALKRIYIAASGTSRHAGLAGKYMIEQLARLPVEVDYASEFQYRNPLAGSEDLTVAITQSGTTADTMGAQREAKERGSRTLAISNVVESTIAREADGNLYTYAGPEIAIASTKAFVAQLTVLFLLALYLGQKRGFVSEAESRRYGAALAKVPPSIDAVLARGHEVLEVARAYHRAEDFLFLGRGVHYPIALDGALKLKEVSYIHAEGYPAGEMKHGPNALIDESLVVVVLATRDATDPDSRVRYDKTVSNLKEVKARSGKVVAVADEGDEEIREAADHVIFVPPAPELLLPLLEIVPLQLLAYHTAVLRGLDVDRPRNLVKSVTQE